MTDISGKTLIVVTGPTGSGKTDLAIGLARRLGCDIISADSRQMFRDTPVATAAPTAAQLSLAPHHLVGFLDLEEQYSASRFDADVSEILDGIWSRSDHAIMCGGSMMYIDAFIYGLDDLPDIDPEIRRATWALYETGGLQALHDELRTVDPAYLDRADPYNYKRLVHAIEVSRQAGAPYSTLLTGSRRQHPFRIHKLCIGHDRPSLFDRINRRTRGMIEAGLEEEARRVFPLRHLNSLNTVGLKEMFSYFDGHYTFDEAVEKIARNTRVYAKKQLTWLKRDSSVIYLPADDPLAAAEKLIINHK